jgi:hypothetical protein
MPVTWVQSETTDPVSLKTNLAVSDRVA